MAEQINTRAEVVERLGGNAAVAQLLNVTPNAVTNWKVRGFPAETFLAITDALQARNLYAPPALWKWKMADAAAE